MVNYFCIVYCLCNIFQSAKVHVFFLNLQILAHFYYNTTCRMPAAMAAITPIMYIIPLATEGF